MNFTMRGVIVPLDLAAPPDRWTSNLYRREEPEGFSRLKHYWFSNIYRLDQRRVVIIAYTIDPLRHPPFPHLGSGSLE